MLHPVSAAPFVSYGQNHEDVILWRALSSVTNGTYVDVGAADPVELSVTKAFYDRGWSGLNIDALPDFVDQLRAARPRDITVQVAVTTSDEPTVTFHELVGTGLSTLVDSIASSHEESGFTKRDLIVPTATLNGLLEAHGFASRPIHFLKVDVEGSEADVLHTIDFNIWRPWVLVIEATEPNSPKPTHDAWEPYVLSANYLFCLFDGISRYYVAQERAAEIGAQLSYPACVLDQYSSPYVADLEVRVDTLWTDVVRWRAAALRSWGRLAAQVNVVAELERRLVEAERVAREARIDAEKSLHAELDGAHKAVELLQTELARVHDSRSWRVTAPLRAARRPGRHGGDA